MLNLRQSYVSSLQRLRIRLDRHGVLKKLEAHATTSRFHLWLRSLLAIYDLQDFVSLGIPWWSFSACDRVAIFLAGCPHARVFEWGSGASTMWLAGRSESVISIEHDQEWQEHVSKLAPRNSVVRLVKPSLKEDGCVTTSSQRRGYSHMDFSEYVDAIDESDGLFDLIVIDGRAREACLLRAVQHLAPRGMIVFDNAERRRYRQVLDKLGPGFRIERHFGLTPALPYPSLTVTITHASCECE